MSGGLTETERETLLCDCGAVDEGGAHGDLCMTWDDPDGFDTVSLVERAERIVAEREAAAARRVAEAVCGAGTHEVDCAYPDEACTCRVIEFREDAARAARAVAAEYEVTTDEH